MKKFFSFFAALLFAGSMMAETYTKTAFADLKSGDVVIITMQKGDNVYAASNDKGTTKAPVATAVTVADNAITTDATNILWTVAKNGNNITFAATDTTFLYCTNTNNGVRVGKNTDNNEFSIDATSGYLFNNSHSRYVGVYNSADFRCYTSVNSNISGQTLAFYAVAGVAPAVAAPVISGTTEFTESTEVTITCETEGAVIYYTTDGNDPNNNSLQYVNPLTLNQTTTVKAVAYIAAQDKYSTVVSKTFTKKEPLVAISCAEVYSKAKGTELALNNVVVAYANAKNVYVQDATGSMLLYLTKNTTWEAGNILSGVEGTLDIYNDLYEVKMTEAQVTAVQPGQGEAPAPVEFTAAPVAADMNKYILLKNVKVDTTAFPTNKNMNATIGDETFVLRNNFNADVAFDTTKLYDITGVVSVYKGAVQVYFISAEEADAPIVGVETIYDWAAEIGTTIFGGNSNITTGTVKIHENNDAINGIKFGSSYVYADGKYIAIKPAEGGFKAGDEISLSVVFNNSDATKYCMADVYAADKTTRLFRSDSASTLNGQKVGEPIVQTYTLASDQDSLLIGRYGNTGMFITLLKVTRALVPPTPEKTYTIAGSPATLFGTAWDPTNAANDMKPITGSKYLYAWEKDSVALTAGDIEFKVCEDHAWTKAWPAQNYKLNIAEAGLYKVSIFFNPELADSAVYATAEKKGEAKVLPNIVLHGNFSGNWADTDPFVAAQDSLTASLTLALAEGNYEFGFKFDGAWKANGANLTREANTTNLAEGNGNMHITADVPGNYVFTYTYETQGVVVTYPEPIIVPDTIDVTMSSLTDPGSLIWTDAVATDGWWQIMGGNDTCAFSLSNGNQITTAAGTYTVADLDANYSYLTVVKANDTIAVAFVDGSITVAVDEAGVVTVVGALLGNDGNVYKFNLTYVDPKAETTVNVTISNGSLIDDYAAYNLYGVYGYADDKTAYVQLGIWTENGFQGNYTEDDFDLKYIGCLVATQAGTIRIFSAAITVTPGNLEGEYSITADLLCYNNTLYKVTMTISAAQGIDAVEAATKAIKSLQNGILTIEKAGKTYNVNGTLIR